MLTPEQYEMVKPYKDVLRITRELNTCLSTKNCRELADIHESQGWGHVNRTCASCLTDCANRVYDLIIEYESRK